MRVLNVALLGHKDHGKSTLIGSLLMQTGAATEVRIKEAKKYSREMHKDFEPAFILDSFHEERKGGLTIDTTRAEIKYKGLAFALIDVPGHEELIKNMISGASYGEMAVLLVSSQSNEGIRDQTKRHLFIARMLGIDRLVVAVNKVDTIGYSKEKFENIKSELEPFIERIGFEKKNVHFVPISAYKGENLVKKSGNMNWYREDTLLNTLYKAGKEKDDNKKGKGLRVILQGSIDGEVLTGKIVNGTMKLGERVIVLPSGHEGRIKEIIEKGKRVKSADTGISVAFKLDKKAKFDTRGSVLSCIGNSPKMDSRIKATIFVTHGKMSNMRIKFNNTEVGCSSLKVLKSIDTTTGKRESGGRMKELEAVEAELRLERRLPHESYYKTKELGRFTLYSGNKFAGIGIIE